MKKTLKHIAVIISIAAVISVAACSKKDNTAKSSPPDFRDSLVGTYGCIQHYYFIMYEPPYTNTDSVIGPFRTTVTTWAADSSVVINGTVYAFSSADSVQTVFAVSTINSLSYAYFGKHNDSIWYQYINYFRVYAVGYYYYVGRKN